MEKVFLSTVIPVYQGALFLEKLVKELDNVRTQLSDDDAPLQIVEAIFVDDSSIDDSPKILAKIVNTYDWTRVITLSRNFGQHPATVAGILHSSGDWVATLDEDLQHHPKYLIPLLLEGIKDSSDVIYAFSKEAVHQSFMRDTISRAYKQTLGALSGNRFVRHFNSFRMMRGSIARAAASVSGHETYFDMVLSWFTDRTSILNLPLKDIRQKSKGKSGYSLMSLMQHARRLLTSARVKPVRLGGLAGIAAMMASLILAVYTMTLRLIDPATFLVRGWASTMMVILFFSGLVSIMIGIALEQLSIILLHTQGKTTFFVVDRSKDLLLKSMIENNNGIK